MICGFKAVWAAIGAISLLAAGTAGCARNDADQLAASAVQTIRQAESIHFQEQSQTAVDGFPLPQLPRVEGSMAGGKVTALAARSGTMAERNTPDAADVPPLRWNLPLWLEHYDKLKGQARLDRAQSDSSSRAVSVKLNPDEVRQLVASELLTQKGDIQRQLAAALQAPPRGVSGAKAGQLRSELQGAAAEQSARLDEMLGSLQAEGEMTFWLDKNNRPLRLSLGTNLRYRSGGQNRTETGQTVYTFGE
ncbi:hypothetical protein SD70_09030 [Gordoniibacillus kamchatkensis]|uniref:Lipoprotein n=1 Tax=Gordoniibacillus kamchatkensis TaxID=1590651 RepID=A0ABR5AJG6_9BACL|nr:hypothetical protein [Paenibacillus sp. VKM B-2647]KIL41164.1 hypothetical protein SD70_09030 [Paenibacillus sp. VKM B-2647]